MGKTSPMQLSLSALRGEGYLVHIVEHFNVFAKVRQDMYGIIDIVAIRDDLPGVLGVQCTDYTSMSKHVDKALTNTNLITWLKAGNKFIIYAWKTVTKDKRKNFILVRREVKLNGSNQLECLSSKDSAV